MKRTFENYSNDNSNNVTGMLENSASRPASTPVIFSHFPVMPVITLVPLAVIMGSESFNVPNGPDVINDNNNNNNNNQNRNIGRSYKETGKPDYKVKVDIDRYADNCFKNGGLRYHNGNLYDILNEDVCEKMKETLATSKLLPAFEKPNNAGTPESIFIKRYRDRYLESVYRELNFSIDDPQFAFKMDIMALLTKEFLDKPQNEKKSKEAKDKVKAALDLSQTNRSISSGMVASIRSLFKNQEEPVVQAQRNGNRL